MKKYVCYYRVSTKKQSKSGLGLEAQKGIIQHYAIIDKAEIIKEYTETQSGKYIENRPILKEAITYCKKNNCTLVVAKLDRLSRNVKDVFTIQEQLGEQFKSCDLPSTDTLTLSIFAGIAQRERELISIRTKLALRAKKDRGEQLGIIKNLTNEGRALGTSRAKENARNHPSNKIARELISKYRAEGYSFQEVANKLNENGLKTVTGKEYKKGTVWELTFKS
ncbi:MAG: recombinase family protein [Arcicella sp.]|jgi:DNA invertase Pin-like site-specific DNA recombinase|nr:recombinase family protein [Arcicella sp.]